MPGMPHNKIVIKSVCNGYLSDIVNAMMDACEEAERIGEPFTAIALFYNGNDWCLKDGKTYSVPGCVREWHKHL